MFAIYLPASLIVRTEPQSENRPQQRKKKNNVFQSPIMRCNSAMEFLTTDFTLVGWGGVVMLTLC